jgi:3-phenylpropionate/trans-cinnamate dioxygenase ferredoxin reductase subunit
MTDTFVIIGANLAGGNAAIALREEGFEGQIILIGAEEHLPYERPPLSKEYLRGEVAIDKAFLQPSDFYASNNIETTLGMSARHVDPKEKLVELASGERIGYDKLLIATGGRNRRPPIPGIDLPGVYELRTLTDADEIRAVAQEGKRVVVVGMGFIGSEVAASLRTIGLNVTVVEGKGAPLGGLLGDEVSGLIETVHRENGVEMHFGDIVASFEGSNHVERVITRGGLRLECDFAVIGVGIEPVTDIVRDTDMKLENGIIVDEYCRTSIEDIFAAGDVANHFHPLLGRHIRVEHWQNAIRQGVAAAKSMMGRGAPYKEVHWFWSDQYDINIQYAGFHVEADQVVMRGKPEERRFITFHLKDGVLMSAAAINRARDLDRSIPLIGSRQLDVSSLADEAVDLRTLVTPATGR